MENSHLYGPALGTACRFVREHPKLLESLARASGNRGDADVLLARFAGERPVRAYLNALSYRRASGAPHQLLTNADAWIDGGERWAIAAEYEHRVTSGTLVQLGLRERRVHQLVFALAYQNGPRVPVALRYLAAFLSSAWNDHAKPEAVRRSLKRLEAADLIELHTGKPSLGQSGRSTVADLTSYLTETSVEPSTDVLADLTVDVLTAIDLIEYRTQSRRDREARERAWKCAPGPLRAATDPAGE